MRCGRSFVSTKLMGNVLANLSATEPKESSVLVSVRAPSCVDSSVHVMSTCTCRSRSSRTNSVPDRRTASLTALICRSWTPGSLGLDSDDDRHRPLASVLTQARERFRAASDTSLSLLSQTYHESKSSLG